MNIRKNNSIFLGILFLLMVNFVNGQPCTGNEIKVSLENVVINATTIEYDVYIENTGTTSLMFAALQGSVIYDSDLLPSGATGTLSVITLPTQTGNFSTMNNFGAFTHTVASRQLRWTQTPVSNPNTVLLPNNLPMFYARFRFTSSMPWTLGTHSLSLYNTSTPGYTITLATIYCNGNSNSTPLAADTNNVQIVNRTFVVTPEVLANNELQTSQSLVSISPNPFNDYFNLSMLTNSNELVEIKVYDITGKLIENETLNPVNTAGFDLGSKFASGVYNIVVRQGEREENHKMIKR